MHSLSLNCHLKISNYVISDFIFEFTAKIVRFGQIQGMVCLAYPTLEVGMLHNAHHMVALPMCLLTKFNTVLLFEFNGAFNTLDYNMPLRL